MWKSDFKVIILDEKSKQLLLNFMSYPLYIHTDIYSTMAFYQSSFNSVSIKILLKYNYYVYKNQKEK